MRVTRRSSVQFSPATNVQFLTGVDSSAVLLARFIVEDGERTFDKILCRQPLSTGWPWE